MMAPRCMNQSAVQRLLKHGDYVIREIDDIDVAEPRVGQGPAYARDPATGWWEYLYDVVIGASATDASATDMQWVIERPLPVGVTIAQEPIYVGLARPR